MKVPGAQTDDDHGLLDHLTFLAPTILNGGRPDQLAPQLETIAGLDFGRHPWACLLAATVAHDVDRLDPRTAELLEQAEAIFQEQGDQAGLGFTAYVRGNFALGLGDLEAASTEWRQARGFLPAVGPADASALAHTALAVYQTGQLRRARSIAEEALALGRSRGQRRPQGIALLYLAFFYAWSGQFQRCGDALAQAEDVYQELAHSDDRLEYPLVLAGRGVLAALRGDRETAEPSFEIALQLADELGIIWYTAIILALRAEFCAEWQPHRSLANARRSLDILIELGDEWWQTWALRSLAIASLAAGETTAAIAGLQDLLKRPLNELERARTTLVLGEALLRDERPEPAVPLLHEAHTTLDRLGAAYWSSRALVALAAGDPKQGRRWRTKASVHDDGDPAYRHVLFGRSALSITMLGQPSVKLHGEQVKFDTVNAELAVYALALAAPSGLHDEILAERLWPEAPADRLGGRLRTLAWQIRKGLGTEGWRLERQRQMNRLETEGVAVDVVEARQAALNYLETEGAEESVDDRRAGKNGLSALGQPFLEHHQYKGWVQHEAADLQVLAGRLARALHGH